MLDKEFFADILMSLAVAVVLFLSGVISGCAISQKHVNICECGQVERLI